MFHASFEIGEAERPGSRARRRKQCLTAMLPAACIMLFAGFAHGAQPPVAQDAANLDDAGDLLNRLFGEERPEDEQALAAIEIKPDEELRYGQQAVESYLNGLKRQGIRVQSRGRDVGYLRRLVETVHPHMRHADRYPRVTVYLADSPRADARSFPGGTLIFYRGMLDWAESEAALVGVIGHELSHLDHGHQLDHLRRWKLAEQSAAGGDPARFVSGGVAFMRMFTHPFRPEDEAEADRDGATWAYRAGYDPRAMAAMFLRAHERDQDQPELRPAFLRTHPFHIERQRAIDATYQQLLEAEPRDDLYVGVTNLRRRVTRADRTFDE